MTPSAAMLEELETRRAELEAAGQPYALATVVRTLDATSAKPGAKALLDGEGTVLAGWVGGGCARGAIKRATLAALADGAPQFVSLKPEDLLAEEGVEAGEARDNIRYARNGCPSRGSMDIFVEPVLPRPCLGICGTGPVALALADLAGRFDLHRVLCAPGADSTDLPKVEEIRTDFALPQGALVVVATQGKGDEAALRHVLRQDHPFVAFVGSKRKFATLSERLIKDGVPRARLDAVQAPAGLDIGAITPEEIALSILAQVVAVRRTSVRAGGEAGSTQPRAVM